MQEQENIKLIQQLYRDFKAGNITALLDKMSNDIEWRHPRVESVPFSGDRNGRDQVAEFFSQLDRYQEPLEFEVDDFVAQGDKVVVQGHYKWRVKENGRQFSANWAHVFRIKGGKVTAHHEYTDTAAVAAAFSRTVTV